MDTDKWGLAQILPSWYEKMRPVTCKHALVDDAGSTDQNCITGHDGSVTGDDHDVTRDKVRGHSFFNLCIKDKEKKKNRKRNILECSVEPSLM